MLGEKFFPVALRRESQPGYLQEFSFQVQSLCLWWMSLGSEKRLKITILLWLHPKSNKQTKQSSFLVESYLASPM